MEAREHCTRDDSDACERMHVSLQCRQVRQAKRQGKEGVMSRSFFFRRKLRSFGGLYLACDGQSTSDTCVVRDCILGAWPGRGALSCHRLLSEEKRGNPASKGRSRRADVFSVRAPARASDDACPRLRLVLAVETCLYISLGGCGDGACLLLACVRAVRMCAWKRVSQAPQSQERLEMMRKRRLLPRRSSMLRRSSQRLAR